MEHGFGNCGQMEHNAQTFTLAVRECWLVFVGSLVRVSVGSLVRWFSGLLICWFICLFDSLVCRFVRLLVRLSVG